MWIIELFGGWEDIKEILQYKSFSYIFKIIWSKLINCDHNNLLASHFKIDKIQEFIIRKYYKPVLY